MTHVRTAFRWLAIALATALLPSVSQAQSSLTKEALFTLHARAEAFRQMAYQNPYDALIVYASPSGTTAMADLALTLFPDEDLGTGFGHFFTHALPIPLNIGEPTQTVAYLHPWSDTLLITLWEPSGNGLMLTDAATAMTSIFRGEDAPYPTNRAWRADPDLTAQEAIGLYTAFTTDGLQLVYEDGGQDVFRNLETELRDAFAYGAALNFMEFRGELLPLLAAKTGPGAEARQLYHAVVLPVLQGLPPKAQISAESTAQAELIAALPADVRGIFLPVFYLSHDSKSVIILSSAQNPDLFIAMRQSHRDGFADLDELALLSFQSFFDLYHALGED
jgi:hypothetical protein